MSTWSLVQAALFLAGSAALVYVSRKPLRAPGSHGFFRFFAWEAILALALLNLPVWFHQPLRPAQLVSWALLLFSIYPVVAGVRLLRAVGRPGARAPAAETDRVAEANYAFENTSQLVRTGIYRFIRHPLYASLLYLTWGVYCKRPGSVTAFGLSAFASLFLWLTARADEAECLRVFGREYADYMRSTRMFVPWVF
ncbi:MAG TPA: hypothetical protein VF832_20650 [Longimicrobiales bacterium]